MARKSKIMYNQLIKDTLKKHRLLLGYGVIGVLAAGLDFFVYTALTSMLHLNYQIANIISVHCGMICSFTLNRQFNFKTKDKTVKRVFTFYCVALFGLGVSALLLYLFVDTLDFHKTLSKLVTILIVALIQFILNKTITFKSK